MGTLSVLKDVEDFLRKDLAGEVLTTRTKTKRSSLLSKVTDCISILKDQNKLDDFLAKQREVSRLQSTDSERSKSYGKDPSEEDDGDYYMDLTEINAAPGEENHVLSPATESGGSGSGYESYASDEEASTRTKSSKEEDLSSYFSPSECDIFTYVYLENKTKFLKGKKWVKRIGIVKENHLKCFKKPSDSTAVLDIPLRAYNTILKNREGTSSIMVILSTPSDGEAHKFSVERDKIDEWSKVLREKTLSLTDVANLPPPPVAARPISTLPKSPIQNTTNGPTPHQPIQRTPSVGVAERSKSVGDVSVFYTDSSPPPVPPGHPSLTQSSPQFNNIGKGIKSAMTVFKKDKTKKRIMAAENLGADVCGHLMVFENKWVKKWCLVNKNQLLVYGKEEKPDLQIELQECDLLPYSDDPERQYGFKIMKDGKEVIYMEASSSTEMGKWVGILIAETGCTEMPETEPDYLPMDIRAYVNSTAKQAFQNRRETRNKKGNRQSAVYSNVPDGDDEELYLDLATANQVTPQSIMPQKIVPPPLPPSSGRPSITQSVPPDMSLHLGNEKQSKQPKKNAKQSDAVDGRKSKSKATKSYEASDENPEKSSAERKKNKQKTSKSSDTGEEKAEKEKTSGDTKKTKQKDKKKDKQAKRHLTLSDISSPTETIESSNAKAVEDASTPETKSPRKVDVNGDKNDSGKSVMDSIIDKRKKELMTQKADIKMKLHTISVKKDTLNSYIEAAATEKERGRLRIMLQKATEEHSKLEKEDVALELELRKLKDRSYDIDSPANKRPPSRREKKPPIRTGATGNVMSKAKMWEAGNATK